MSLTELMAELDCAMPTDMRSGNHSQTHRNASQRITEQHIATHARLGRARLLVGMFTTDGPDPRFPCIWP